MIETGVGNCHTYVDNDADLDMATEILYNAKCQRPSVCNAAETLLVAEKVASEFLPRAKERLDGMNVEWRGCEKTKEILHDIKDATEEDYYTEFLDYIIAVKVVSGVEEAVAHINKYGSGHSEAIVTNNYFPHSDFSRKLMRHASMSMHQPGLPMVLSLGLEPKSAFQRRRCMREGRWGWMN